MTKGKGARNDTGDYCSLLKITAKQGIIAEAKIEKGLVER